MQGCIILHKYEMAPTDNFGSSHEFLHHHSEGEDRSNGL